MSLSNSTPVFHVSTSAGFSFRTANEEDARKAVEDQLACYGYPKADGFVTDLTVALRNNALNVGDAPWFYGHVSITAEDHDRTVGHWGGHGCACPIPTPPCTPCADGDHQGCDDTACRCC